MLFEAGYNNYMATVQSSLRTKDSVTLIGNGALVLCSEVVPISEVHDFLIIIYYP